MQPSDLTTTSFGRFSCRPWKLLAITVRLPSGSSRVTRLVSCSHAINLPCRSRVRPLARFVGSRKAVTPAPGSYFIRLLLWNIAEQQVATFLPPNRPFGWAERAAEAVGEMLNRVGCGNDLVQLGRQFLDP